MSVAPPSPADDDSAWSWAEEVAARHRAVRLHPGRRRTKDRVVAPVVVALWMAAVVLAAASLTTGESGAALGLAGLAALAAYAGLGGWWLGSTGRFVIRGSARSIRAALPPGAGRSVRRRLSSREPLDERHADVVLELAHQDCELAIGQAFLVATYLPLYVDFARSLHGRPIDTVSLSIGAACLGAAAVLVLTARLRLTRLLSRRPSSRTVTH